MGARQTGSAAKPSPICLLVFVFCWILGMGGGGKQDTQPGWFQHVLGRVVPPQILLATCGFDGSKIIHVGLR